MKIVPLWWAIKRELKQTCLKEEKHIWYTLRIPTLSVTILNYASFSESILSKLVEGKKDNIVHISPLFFLLYAAICLTTKPSTNTYTHILSTTFAYKIEASHLFFRFLWNFMGALCMPLGILKLSRLCNQTSSKSNLMLPT